MGEPIAGDEGGLLNRVVVRITFAEFNIEFQSCRGMLRCSKEIRLPHHDWSTRRHRRRGRRVILHLLIQNAWRCQFERPRIKESVSMTERKHNCGVNERMASLKSD